MTGNPLHVDLWSTDLKSGLTTRRITASMRQLPKARKAIPMERPVRTTISLSPALHMKFKVRCALARTTMNDVVLELIERDLAALPKPKAGKSVKSAARELENML